MQLVSTFKVYLGHLFLNIIHYQLS